MIIALIAATWDEFRQNIRNRRDKRSNDKFNKLNGPQKQSITILQKRYGYTREQAKSELHKHYSKARLR